jgi:hypothetical protein
LLQHLPIIVHGIYLRYTSFHRGTSEGVGSGLLHWVAFRISLTCSAVFTIMRFPLRVVAIMGVFNQVLEREDGMIFGVLCLVEFLQHSACSAVICLA